MPGTGPLRRSSAPARKKAIVGKSRVEPELLQSPAFVFLLFVNGIRARSAAYATRRHVDTVLHLVAAPPRCDLRASLSSLTISSDRANLDGLNKAGLN